jgi:hypothetical protein
MGVIVVNLHICPAMLVIIFQIGVRVKLGERLELQMPWASGTSDVTWRAKRMDIKERTLDTVLGAILPRLCIDVVGNRELLSATG